MDTKRVHKLCTSCIAAERLATEADVFFVNPSTSKPAKASIYSGQQVSFPVHLYRPWILKNRWRDELSGSSMKVNSPSAAARIVATTRQFTRSGEARTA